MSNNGPQKKDFSEVLEHGAQIDDIFKDSPTPRGSNPYDGLTIETVALEEAQHNAPAVNDEEVAIVDNDSLFCINRKYAALEAMFRLVAREHYSFGQLMSEILRIALEQVKSEAGSFLEIDYQKNCMFFRAVTGRSSQGLLNFTVPVGQGIAGFVCETQQPMTLSSVDDSSVYLRSISNAVGFEAKTLAAYPVVIRGMTFGCIELLNRIGEPQFTDSDKEVLQTISEYAAKVIENRLLMAAISKELNVLKGKSSGEDAA
jgi:GAF domain-containing protein